MNLKLLGTLTKKDFRKHNKKLDKLSWCDNADLTLLSLYHAKYNALYGIEIADIDVLINLAMYFNDKYYGTKWENSKLDWESTLIKFYNKYKPSNWNAII